MAIRTIVAAALGLALSACGPNVLNTSVKGQAQLQGDPNGLLGLLSSFPGVSGFSNIDFSQDQEFKNQGVKKENVVSVKVTGLKLNIVSPSDGDFRFLESLQFSAKANGQEDVIADKVGINSLPASRTLSMDVKGAELQPYVVAPSMTISTAGKGHYPKSDTVLEAILDLRVEWKLF